MDLVKSSLTHDLQTLNELVASLNQAVDVRAMLPLVLPRLVALVGLQTGWILLQEPAGSGPPGGPGGGFVLAAHHQLPPALLDEAAWQPECDCQRLFRPGQLTPVLEVLECSRLAGANGEPQFHASLPLRSGERLLGILNVAGPERANFDARTLALLANVASQMGAALERARLYELVQEQRIPEQRALLDFTNQLLSRRDLPAMLDFLVTEVRRLLNMDACAVLLQDRDDPGFLHFVAASGWFQDPVAARRRVPAGDASGSGRAMQTQQPLVHLNAHALNTLPWTREWLVAEQFFSAAIVPLVAEGQSIGSLVVDSRQPRQLTADEVRFLQVMANQAAIALETARLHQEELHQQRLAEELTVGRQIQLSMLPPACPLVPGWDFCAHYDAARQVGGDFYDFYRAPGRGRHNLPSLGILVADVADKGVPAALFMALSCTILRHIALTVSEPAEALALANDFILNDSRTDLFLTAFYGVLDTETGQFVYASAGHNPPLLYRAAQDDVVRLHAAGIALGVVAGVHLEEGSILLQPGDCLVLYTDGVTEAMDSQLNEFGVQRLADVLLTAGRAAAGAAVTLDQVLAAVRAHNEGLPPWDDMTLLVVRRAPAGASPNPLIALTSKSE